MKPLTPAGLAALLHVGCGREVAEAEVARARWGALAASFAILCGLVKTGAADGPAMRAYCNRSMTI